jgi:DNA-binding NarL/FixJ family response regulator
MGDLLEPPRGRSGERIRVLIIEDHKVVAEGLVALLSSHARLEVCGAASSVAEAMDLVGQTDPDIVLVDQYLPDGTGAEALKRMRRTLPDVKAVFLSVDQSDATLLAAIDAGARAFVAKSAPASLMIEALERVMAGELLIPADRVVDLIARDQERQQELAHRATLAARLTSREREVLRLMRDGLGNQEVARRLKIRYQTVRGHVRNLMKKLDAHSRLEAVAKAAGLGVFEDS